MRIPITVGFLPVRPLTTRKARLGMRDKVPGLLPCSGETSALTAAANPIPSEYSPTPLSGARKAAKPWEPTAAAKARFPGHGEVKRQHRRSGPIQGISMN